MTRSLNIDRFEQADREWKGKLVKEFRNKFQREDGLIDKYSYDEDGDPVTTPDAIVDWLLPKLDEYVEFFNSEPEEGTEPELFICNNCGGQKTRVRGEGAGLRCFNCKE